MQQLSFWRAQKLTKLRSSHNSKGWPLASACNVAWALHEERPGFGPDSGGYVCIPGSNKPNYPIPLAVTSSLDLQVVYKPRLAPGDVSQVAHLGFSPRQVSA